MTHEQWQQISEIVDAASELPPGQRDAYVLGVCPDEITLREVRSLLAHASGEDFLSIDPERFIGKSLCHYQITGYIGRGNMGHVFKAHDGRLRRPVAVKLLPPKFKKDPQAVARLEREARSASALSHPNILIVHAIEYDEPLDMRFIVMEYVSGNTLASLISGHRGLAVEQAHRYALQIASSLVAAHEKGILHGDLKPANIMINEHDLVKVLDFGLARARDRDLSDPTKSEFFGSTGYMAPERIGLPLIDPRSEIFSFGVILQEILSGEHPFGTGDRDELAKAIHMASPKPLPSTVPAWLVEIVDRCLAKTITERFQTMEAVLSALNREGHDSIQRPAIRTTGDIAKIQGIAARISYTNVAASEGAVNQLQKLFGTGLSVEARDAAISVLREAILTLDAGRAGVPGTVRKVRRFVMEALKLFTTGNLGPLFASGELEELDLFEMDLSNTIFESISFHRCFIVCANFRGSRLARSSFAEALIRNVDFTGADLTDVDFTDADWFNASGLTEAQLVSAQRETLRPCPPDIEAMFQYLDDHYGFPFDSWPTRVQNQIRAAWSEYLKPGGLHDVVARWHGQSR